MILSEDNFKQIFAFADRYSRLAKLLYNAALFRIRQVFTGWDKEERTNLEKSVFVEIQCAKETYKGFTCRRVLSYKALDKILRANKNPDFFAGLPMQTAQSIVRQATIDFKVWLSALKVYKKDPSSFTGRPRMPRYCRLDKKNVQGDQSGCGTLSIGRWKRLSVKVTKYDRKPNPSFLSQGYG